MQQVMRETPLTIKEALKVIPKITGRRMHYSGVYRWVTQGLCGVRLETWRAGTVIVTSEEALWRFFDRVTTAQDRQRDKAQRTRKADKGPGEAERRKSREAARRNLEACGVLRRSA